MSLPVPVALRITRRAAESSAAVFTLARHWEPFVKFQTRTLLVAAAIALVTACGKKEEMPVPAPVTSAPVAEADQSTADLICSYAPSQSAVVAHVASVAGGGAAAAAAIAKAAGLTAVAHSSGAYIFTGAGGYLAGTLGTAIAGPAIVGVGLVVGGSAATVELLCTPKNHPEMAEKVEAAAQEYFNRAKSIVVSTSKAAEPVVAAAKVTIIKAGNDAFEYGSRKTVEVSQVFKK